MEKLLGRRAEAASRRSRRAHSEWNVESHGRSGGTPARRRSSETRFCISSAALLVNVTARIDSAGTPLAMSLAIRNVMARVLPVPAPARMRTGPSVLSAARRCSVFREWRKFCMSLEKKNGDTAMLADAERLRKFRKNGGQRFELTIMKKTGS